MKCSQQALVPSGVNSETQSVHLRQRLIGRNPLDMNTIQRAKEPGALLPDAAMNQRRPLLCIPGNGQEFLDLFASRGVLMVARDGDEPNAGLIADAPLRTFPGIRVVLATTAAQCDNCSQAVLLDELAKLVRRGLSAPI
jgi:hypothetical protein